MLSVRIVLKNSFDLVLDSKLVDIAEDQDGSAAIKAALIDIIGEWVIDRGDTISIVEA